MRSPGRPDPSRVVQRQFWRLITTGITTAEAALGVGVSAPVGTRWFRHAGGMPPICLAEPSGRYLSFEEREEIAILRAQGKGVRQIARAIGRDPGTISRELRRNAATRGRKLQYRATVAQWKAQQAAKRPKTAKLVQNRHLRDYVQDRLAGNLRRPDDTIVAGPEPPAWKGLNHRSHCIVSPARCSIRSAGSTPRYSGRITRTRSFRTVIDRVHPIRSAITVAGMLPEPRIPVGAGQVAMLPVLVMTLAYSRFISARMIPTRTAADILAGMWALIAALGAVPKRLWWDRESSIGGSGRVSASAAAFAGTLATRIVLAPPADPEFKGMVERHNGYFETSFLPGRTFTSPDDFNAQLAAWLPRANQRLVRSLASVTGSGAGGRPVDHLAADLAAMTALPPVAPTLGWHQRVRLGRDYYVRLDAVDYSVDPSVIGRLVDVHADLERVRVYCDRRLVADHARCWARQQNVTDPAHREQAARLRAAWQADQAARAIARRHGDGHPVALRAARLRRPVRDQPR